MSRSYITKVRHGRLHAPVWLLTRLDHCKRELTDGADAHIDDGIAGQAAEIALGGGGVMVMHQQCSSGRCRGQVPRERWRLDSRLSLLARTGLRPCTTLPEVWTLTGAALPQLRLQRVRIHAVYLAWIVYTPHVSCMSFPSRPLPACSRQWTDSGIEHLQEHRVENVPTFTFLCNLSHVNDSDAKGNLYSESQHRRSLYL